MIIFYNLPLMPLGIYIYRVSKISKNCVAYCREATMFVFAYAILHLF